MLTISKPLSGAQARTYHAEEFTNARDNYYTNGSRISGMWHGRLAAEWRLRDDVEERHFSRLADGQHPITGDQLVEHQTPRRHVNAFGREVMTMEHRAGWDATFSAPKSVSLTALVGGDERVRIAHRMAVFTALIEAERFVQARPGGNLPAETTGRWVAATFEHDSARPVNGYAAPQLHTHVVVFNVTETDDGDARPLQPRELFKSQQFLTAVYRSELAMSLRRLGYDIDRGASGQPEIHGYTQDYLEASSPRRQQIEGHLEARQLLGAAAAQLAAHQTRERKVSVSHEDMQRAHQALAARFGHQPARVLDRMYRHHQDFRPDPVRATQVAVTFGRDRNFERESVVDERSLLRDALQRSMGEVRLAEVRIEFEDRLVTGEFIAIGGSPATPNRTLTTREMQTLERESVEMMRRGQHQHEGLSLATLETLAREQPHLSAEQARAVQEILHSQDKIMALEGVAGAGKTTTLSAVRTHATQTGYAVEGFALTSRAAQKLADSGIPSGTLQGHLTRTDRSADHGPHLYVLDEASLAGTRQMHAFFQRLNHDDRVLLVGDVRQHHAVEAGRPYQQLQGAGMETARLETIVRQQDPALRAVVEHLSRGEVKEAIEALHGQGRVHEIHEVGARFEAIAREYVRDPTGTLVVSPDNRSRVEINNVIHRAMQDEGRVEAREQRVRILVPRQDVTGADRQWAERYTVGDVVRYSKGSEIFRVGSGDYGRVEHINGRDNLVTVSLRSSGERVTYDPRRLQGVTLYRHEDRTFSKGDRVQLTARDREHDIANRELGTIEKIQRVRLQVRLDSGRALTLPTNSQLHLDHGYAVTSHSSQGQTADRVLVHVDTQRASEVLVNERLAYVAVSRGRHDAQLYTDNGRELVQAISRGRDLGSALESSTSASRHSQPGHSLERSRQVEQHLGIDTGR
jgi:conjugative relaxase-like TrwC/TraI family protein